MRKNILVLLCFAGLALDTHAIQQPDSVLNHVDSALRILRTNSLYRKAVNWQSVSGKIHEEIKENKTKYATFSALKIAFSALGDKHASYYHYDQVYKPENTSLTSRYSDSLLTTWKKGPVIIAQMLDTKAYLRIPYIGANTQNDIDKMANQINEKVLSLYAKNPSGWIIDLRLNAGGNIRPMVAGLVSFFKDGILGYYIDADGKLQECMAIGNGKFLIDRKPQATLHQPTVDLSKSIVAVLIGPGTGSAGEALAIHFKQRPNTASFGENSAGLANATNGFLFDNNNAYFLISVARLGDKNGRPFPEVVIPEFITNANDHFSDLTKDNTTNQALKWLSKKHNR